MWYDEGVCVSVTRWVDISYSRGSMVGDGGYGICTVGGGTFTICSYLLFKTSFWFTQIRSCQCSSVLIQC